jgi:hypothetical protein
MIGHNDGVDVRLGNGNGTFQAPNRIARGFIANTVGSGDFNKDGNPDIAASSETSASAMIIHGNGNGTFQSPNAYATRDNAGPFFVTDFDFDVTPRRLRRRAPRRHYAGRWRFQPHRPLWPQ